ncbi:unnamed protein product [Cuscuta epithymum]|uniref:Uncharacterized protein n=1 Tax=Cuscuta epithymum TaxID=186058 RepID=A0AAV0DQH2_9ASTE|nr:unnamed protein product [Cuscuta epithymum]
MMNNEYGICFSPSSKGDDDDDDDDERIIFIDVPHNMQNDRPIMKNVRITEVKNDGAMVTERKRIVNISNINFESGMTRFAVHGVDSLLNGCFEELHNIDNTYSCDRKNK